MWWRKAGGGGSGGGGGTADTAPKTKTPHDNVGKKFSFPYSAQEPNVSAEELQPLLGLQVFLPDNLPQNAKSLSTRFVRTWREKKDNKGNAIWLRRSRLVAREYIWLQLDRECLFSPATSNIASRVLPACCFLVLKEHKDVFMVSIDVKDAFLTVVQEVETKVQACGEILSLGRVLPGQRDGSLRWYRDLHRFTKDCFVETVEFKPYPSILKSKKGDYDHSC